MYTEVTTTTPDYNSLLLPPIKADSSYSRLVAPIKAEMLDMKSSVLTLDQLLNPSNATAVPMSPAFVGAGPLPAAVATTPVPSKDEFNYSTIRLILSTTSRLSQAQV